MKFVLVCAHLVCVSDIKVVWCHPVSVAIIMPQQNGSVKCYGCICCCWWGAQAAVKTEEAEQEQKQEQEQTGSVFSACPHPGNTKPHPTDRIGSFLAAQRIKCH